MAGLVPAISLRGAVRSYGIAGTSPAMTENRAGKTMAKGHKDKVAVITGAAGGIGQAFAKRLAEDGVHIAIADMSTARDR